MGPLVIVALMLSSLVLASAGAGGFLSLVLHLMSRSALRLAPVRPEPVPVAVPVSAPAYQEMDARAA